MNELVFLPDRTGRDVLTDAVGFVRLGADGAPLEVLSRRVVTRDAGVDRDAEEIRWRAVLALTLMCDLWPDTGAQVNVLPVRAEDSPFAAWALAACPEQELRLVTLCREGSTCLMGLTDAACGLKLPATPADLTMAALPQAAWIDPESGSVQDPAPFLEESERRLLAGRIRAMGLSGDRVQRFLQALDMADVAEENAVGQLDEDALQRLEIRVTAVCGMAQFDALASLRTALDGRGGNPLAACFGAAEEAATPAERVVWTWQGQPFAWQSRALGLTGTGHEGEMETLASLRSEMDVMEEHSVRWCRQTAQALHAFLSARPGMMPQARERLLAVQHRLQEKGRQVQMTVSMTWPWNGDSCAVQAIMKEALGAEGAEAAREPFCDLLTLAKEFELGDAALMHVCAQEEGVYLPPLSAHMARFTARAEEGGGLAMDAIRFQKAEDGSVTASFLMRGPGEMRLMRTYAPEEQLTLESWETPVVAVWPCLPLAGWHAYHVFSRGGDVQVRALKCDEWCDAGMTGGAWQHVCTGEYPACLSLMQGERCLGAIPNALPAHAAARMMDAVAALDVGSMSVVTALSMGGQRAESIDGPALTRMLLSPVAFVQDDFLAALTPRGITPAAVRLTGAGTELFTDGSLWRAAEGRGAADLEAGGVKTFLKWRSGPDTVRARRLMLHQVMLGMSLTAVMNGARSIQWRVTVADEMGDEGRDELLQTMQELQRLVAEQSGLPVTAGAEEIRWAEESVALSSYLRGEGGMPGTCMAMDLGLGSTKMHLWVQGRSRPAAGAVLTQSLYAQLLDALRARPEWLRADFADCGDEALAAAVDALCGQLTQAAATSAEADKAMLMLCELLENHRAPVTQHLGARFAAQQPTWLQSVLLETLAATLFTAGLMLAGVGEDTMLNHLLPQDLTLCLNGRGAWLLNTMPPAMRNSLQHLTRSVMRLDHPVRFVTLRASPRPMEATALGLTALRDGMQLADAPRVRTRESFSALMCTMVRQFVSAFPGHAWMLHEGLFDARGALTPLAEDTIRRLASVSYGDGEDIPESVMDFVRRLRQASFLPPQPANSADQYI